MNRLLKPTEVDELLGYGPGRTLKLAKAGLIPFIELPDGQVRFDKKDLEQFLEAARQSGKPSSGQLKNEDPKQTSRNNPLLSRLFRGHRHPQAERNGCRRD